MYPTSCKKFSSHFEDPWHPVSSETNKPIVYTPQTVMNSLLQFEDDEEDYPVHQLESIDVIEEKDGITISDIFDGNNLFINDDDLVYLYEILKERLISKYWKFIKVFHHVK